MKRGGVEWYLIVLRFDNESGTMTADHKNRISEMYIIRDVFDFEIGYLEKSPCRDCSRRRELPVCAEQCSLLARIQTLLAKGVSCTGRHYPTEP
ncbi:MAG: hypothetical protein ACOC8R_02580 [Desulfosalsimonas sp.]